MAIMNLFRRVTNAVRVFAASMHEICEKIFYIVEKFFIKLTGDNKYLRLIRLHKPIPYLLLLTPVYWVLIVGGKNIVQNFVVFTLGGVIMRSFGCVINDICDRKIDPLCERTRNRPLALGEVSLFQAISVLGILGCVAAALLIFLPEKSRFAALIAVVLALLYPLSKRFTQIPQLFLGIAFNMGVFLAWFTQFDQLSFVAFLLYGAAAAWTIGYDSFYGHQDILDDKNLNIGSSALVFGEKLGSFVWSCYKLSCCTLLVIGVFAHMHKLFFIITLFAFYVLRMQVENWRYDEHNQSGKLFVNNAIFAVLTIIAFLAG